MTDVNLTIEPVVLRLVLDSNPPSLEMARLGDRGVQGIQGNQGNIGLPAQNIKSAYIISPNSTEDIVLFFTDAGLEITKILIAVTGGGEATWNLIKSSTRSATGTNVFTIDKATTGASTIESFDEPTVSADSYIRFSLLSFTGLITDIHLTLFYNLI